jgi:GTP-binding protein EngB required for normal cell division
MPPSDAEKPAGERKEQAHPIAPRSLLREYEKVKLELAGLVREGMVQAGSNEQALHEGQGLLTRLAEDRINVAVVGRFSRGKTSLMNAVLGWDRLPTGILPLTSVLTMVRYGSRERVLVCYENSYMPHEISLEQITDYVTQDGNPGNRKGVDYVEVQIPSETLRRGFSFVDTPGLGSTIAENTSITTGFFQEMDAVVVVTSFEAALSQEEMEFLRHSVQGGRRTFLVINKQDLVTGEERDKVLRYVEDRLTDEVGAADIRVFAVSARDGLHAKQEGDARKLQNSGLSEFEQELVRFLTSEKAEKMLTLTCRRLLDLVASAGISSDAAVPTRVREIQGKLLNDGGQEPASGVPASTAAFLRSDQVRLDRSCPICGEVVARIFDFLCQYQYRLSTSREAQSAHSADGGFCAMHTWQYEKIASPHGVCAAYAEFLETVAHRLRSMAGKAESAAGLSLGIARLAVSSPTCKACQVQASAEEDALSKWLSKVSGTGKNGPQELPLLCFLHLPAFLARIVDLELARRLTERQAEVCERVSENMQRSALKHDARRRALLSDEEKRAHLQGLMILAGHRRVAAAGTETEGL